MSMLTPPGMGGKYRITGDRYPRMRPRRGRRRMVLGAVGAITALGLLSFGAVQLLSGRGESVTTAAHTAPCTAGPEQRPVSGQQAEPVRPPEPAAVTVNVYNATQRTGLARKTADELGERGFTIGAVENAPPELDGKVRAAGLLVAAPELAESGTLALLGAHLADAEPRTDAARRGEAAESVDLVLGDAYRALARPQAAARTLTALASPSPSPSPSGC
ncbi:LytR C-terminal domain-containing protein [Streptomyces sp. TRM 70351]|uniref:LytR C-terminal domain-containing protein n=1 Tax=Streptomyces sp. TRM 70351 TaxID=3116552 RepID=UPI002E7C43F9|nr:LytR C-terminal domain-containing protein [Streptomyces sp. TRM 70351]MEE1929786.1 LytR C-terminal domain-containing protein [Streptomyces sp. TRM 70351]